MNARGDVASADSIYGAMLLLKRIVLELHQRLTIELVNCSEFCEVFEMLDVHCNCVHCTVYVQS